jgi:hypothetical protein
MGKKDRKTLDKMKSSFIEGATKKGHPKKSLEKYGLTGKPLRNTLSINHTLPVMHWLPTKPLT